MVNRLHDIISNKLSHDFKLHIGLLEADKLVIVLPVDVMNEHCSEVFDLIYIPLRLKLIYSVKI